jgi:hypothetical protein
MSLAIWANRSPFLVLMANGVVAMSVVVVLVPLWRFGGRLAQPSADETRGRDSRPPVILFRSFRDDPLRVDRFEWDRVQRKGKRSFEETLTHQLWRVGPVTAIGRPGEGLPPVGAARAYFTNDKWQENAERWAQEARLIVMIVGGTEGLAWEFRMIFREHMVIKTMFVFPPGNEDRGHWEQFAAQAEPFFGRLICEPSGLIGVLFPAPDLAVVLRSSRKRNARTYEVAMAACLELLEPPK